MNTNNVSASPSDHKEKRVHGAPMPGNPSDAYPPTRPGPVIIIVAVLLAVVVVGVENWPDVTALAKSAGL